MWLIRKIELVIKTIEGIPKLLYAVQPGLLDAHLKPLQKRIEQLLQQGQQNNVDVASRVRILHKAVRIIETHTFQLAATALLQRKQLDIEYHNRSSDESCQRTVSPQRIVYYLDHWYMDAWCHQREALRTFAMDRIKHIKLNTQPAKDISEEALNKHLATSYGIFAGEPRHHAVLKFTPEHSR